MGMAFQRGAACHKVIDAFTDSHPCVMRSRRRIDPPYRRFSGVLVDLYYDHLLALEWRRYCTESLESYTSDFSARVQAMNIWLPPEARLTLGRILESDLLLSYRRVEGVGQALRRISIHLEQRWGRPFSLQSALPLMVARHAELTEDFTLFFPQLRAHVAGWLNPAERR